MPENVFDHENLKKDAVILKAVQRSLLMAEAMQLMLTADQMVQLEAAVMTRLRHASCWFHDWAVMGWCVMWSMTLSATVLSISICSTES